MIGLASTKRTGLIDMVQPINRQSSFARGLVSAYVALPGLMTGPRFIDLMNPGTNGNHGTLTNAPTWSGLAPPGGWGSIKTVAASSQMVNCGTFSAADGSSKCSFGGWVYRSATSELVSAGFTGGSFTGGGNRFSYIWYSDGNIYISAELSAASYGYVGLSGTGWHRVDCVFDGTQGSNATRLVVFIDSIQQTLTYAEAAVPATIGTVSPFTLGRDANDRYADGWYDGFQVFPGVALTSQQVLSLYNESRLGYPTLFNRISRPMAYASGAAAAATHHRLMLLGVGA